MPVDTGLAAHITVTVTDADTAIMYGTGDVPVLATPRLVTLCEQAAVAAVSSSLAKGKTTVGTRVEVAHLAPTPVGRQVDAEATLDRVDGKRLTFNVSVQDDRGLVAAGKVTRVVVDRDEFVRSTEA